MYLVLLQRYTEVFVLGFWPKWFSNKTKNLLQGTENWKQIFTEMKLHGLVPNSYIYVSVSDLYENQEQGRTVSCLGIHKSDLVCNVGLCKESL